jgi:hypothetical protein
MNYFRAHAPITLSRLTGIALAVTKIGAALAARKSGGSDMAPMHHQGRQSILRNKSMSMAPTFAPDHLALRRTTRVSMSASGGCFVKLDEGVNLVKISINCPIDFEPQNAADIHCIDLDLKETSFESALAWIRETQSWRIESNRLPLCVVVICHEEALSIDELWRVSAELEPAGAIFHGWPEACTSFDEAFRLFGQSMVKRQSTKNRMRR